MRDLDMAGACVRPSVAARLREAANARRLYEAMMVTAFGTPTEMQAIRERVRRDIGRTRALLEGGPDGDGGGGGGGSCATELIDDMLRRAVLGGDVSL